MANQNIIRIGVTGVAIVLIGLVLAGFAGRFFAPGDAAAVVRPLAGALLIPLGAVLWGMRARRMAGVAMGLAVLALGSVVPGFVGSDRGCSEGCLTLYQKNLLSKAWPRYPLADDIIASGAGVVTLQEVSDHNRRFMAKMFDHYPGAVTCRFRPAQDVAILTSLRVVAGTEFCLTGAGMAGIRVLDPDGRAVWVVSIHLEWPFPYDQFRQSETIAAHLATLDAPVIIAGDFNMVPWGGSVRRIARSAGNRALGPFRNTYLLGREWLPLPIDMVLVPEGATGSVARRGYMGSDHRGVLAHIALR